MTRVSLKEAYDNKDVVAQIYAIRDIAEGAENNANSAVSTANTASEHVDALVPQVEGAVQTVAGYENRLSAVEGETAGLDSDLNAVTLRVTTTEGQIVTIQGRVTALETADGQNVKLTGTQTIDGVKHFVESPTAPTTTTGIWDVQVANGQKVKNELDNYSPMVRTTGAQTIAGTKKFINNVEAQSGITGGANPQTYTSNYERFKVSGTDNFTIVGIGFEKGSSGDSTRLVFSLNANTNTETGNQPGCQIHYILDNVSGTLKMQPAYIDKNGKRTFGDAQPLMTWTP